MNKQSRYLAEVAEINESLAALVKRRSKTDDSVGRLAFVLQCEIKAAENELAKFSEKLSLNPSNAFTWADSAVQAAASLDVFAGLGWRLAPTPAKEGVTDETRLAHVREFTYRELQRRAALTNQSTSAMSNLVARCELAAYAKLFDTFSGAFAPVL